jgi:hypothetical protein
MKCACCGQEIYDGETVVPMPDDTLTHEDCADSYITDNKERFGFVKKTYRAPEKGYENQ